MCVSVLFFFFFTLHGCKLVQYFNFSHLKFVRNEVLLWHSGLRIQVVTAVAWVTAVVLVPFLARELLDMTKKCVKSEDTLSVGA